MLVVSRLRREIARDSGALALIRQSKDIKCVARLRMVHIGLDHPWNVPRAAAAQARRDGDILLAAHAERYRETLHRRAQSNLPESLPGVHVKSSEVPI